MLFALPRRFVLVLLAGFLAAGLSAASVAGQDSTLATGSKKFTENVTLGWMATHALAHVGYETRHRSQLGGSRFLWDALVRGDIDVYPEYTGTLRQEILSGVPSAALADTLAAYGIAMTQPIGFNNTYALGMRPDRADSLGIRTIGDLRNHPDLDVAFSNEFMDRADGWPGLKQTYRLPHTATGVDHDLAYRGLATGSIDVTDLYTTDAEIRKYDLRVLADDRNYFPTYEAVYLYRTDLPEDAVAVLRRFEGRIDEDRMQSLNARAKIDQVPEAQVAADFVEETFGWSIGVKTQTWIQRVAGRTTEHLWLVGVSMALAILVGIPTGILAALSRTLGSGVLLLVGLTYTIPSLALLAVMVPPLGLGRVPAVAALFIYSLLPIVWNTYTGLNSISTPLLESAKALGLTRTARLVRVELPLASRAIFAGVKVAAVINIGTATLGALIGAGGYGQPILTGIRRANLDLILEGTLPAAVLTILVLALLEGLERLLLPRPLKTSG